MRKMLFVLSEWGPSSPPYLRDMEAYYRRRRELEHQDLANYDAIMGVGGSGARVDPANKQRLHSLQHEERN